MAHLHSGSSLLLLLRLYFLERFLQTVKMHQTNVWVKESSLKLFLHNHWLFHTIGLKTSVHYELIKIAVLPPFTLSLTTSCLSCASLLPLPLLSSKAQHYTRCGPADRGTTGRGSTMDEERKSERASTLQLWEWGQCFRDKLDSVPK